MPVVDGMQPNLGLMSPLLAIPVVLLAYWATLRRLRLNNLVLLVAGFWRYAWGSPVGGLLLFILTLFNYFFPNITSSAQYGHFAWLV
jgi:D-alanyl-lipoteichoic acid acyltransferase DltB (MBOAT superfamily)